MGRVEPVRFLKYATVIEPDESDLEVGMFVFCGEESSENVKVEVRLSGASSELASGVARIDGGEIIDISWFRSARLRTSAFTLSRFGDVDTYLDEEGQEALKTILTGGSEAILSFEPFGGEEHYFRLKYSELASDDACLAVLADGAWRSITYLHEALQRGGCRLERGRVSAVLLDLEKDGRLEGKFARNRAAAGRKAVQTAPGRPRVGSTGLHVPAFA